MPVVKGPEISWRCQIQASDTDDFCISQGFWWINCLDRYVQQDPVKKLTSLFPSVIQLERENATEGGKKKRKVIPKKIWKGLNENWAFGKKRREDAIVDKYWSFAEIVIYNADWVLGFCLELEWSIKVVVSSFYLHKTNGPDRVTRAPVVLKRHVVLTFKLALAFVR